MVVLSMTLHHNEIAKPLRSEIPHLYSLYQSLSANHGDASFLILDLITHDVVVSSHFLHISGIEVEVNTFSLMHAIMKWKI